MYWTPIAADRRIHADASAHRRGSPTAALGDDHAVVLVLVRDRSLVVDVQDRDGVEARRHAAGAPGLARIVGVQHCLYDGVLGRRQVVAQREVAPTRALVCLSYTPANQLPHYWQRLAASLLLPPAE